jgi:hypothetical protein
LAPQGFSFPGHPFQLIKAARAATPGLSATTIFGVPFQNWMLAASASILVSIAVWQRR